VLMRDQAHDDVRLVLLQELVHGVMDLRIDFPDVFADVEGAVHQLDSAFADDDAVAPANLERRTVRSGLVAVCFLDDGFKHPAKVGLSIHEGKGP